MHHSPDKITRCDDKPVTNKLLKNVTSAALQPEPLKSETAHNFSELTLKSITNPPECDCD